jgi:transposase
LADVEIMARVERRRKWTAKDKAALLAEVAAAGGRVSIVARRHGIAESVLYNWRAAWKAASAVLHSQPSTAFIPLGLVDGSAHRTQTPLTGPSHLEAGKIEIALPNGARISVDAFVNEKTLARVLRAMKGIA